MPELNNTILRNSSNLKTYYRLEGNSTDETGVNTGTDTNMSYSTGKFGQGAVFNGTSARINCGSNAALGITGAISISVWVNVTAFPTAGNIGSMVEKKFDGTNEGYYLTLNDTLLTVGSYNGTAFESQWTRSGWNTGEWHHVVGLYDGANWRLYFDGKCVNTTAKASGALSSTGEVSLGASNINGTVGRWFNGTLDDVSIWNTALSADQIKELYEGRYVGEGWPQAGLVAGYHLNGNSTDFSGNGYNGTDTAMTYSLANGKFGKGGGFDGVSTTGSRIATSIVPPTTSFTLSCWVNYASFTDQGSIVGFSDNAATRYISLLRAGSGSSSMRFSLVDTTTKLDHPATLSLSTWYHIVGVYDDPNNLMYIYVNGNGVSGAASVTLNSTGHMAIGSLGEYVSSAMLNGKADEIHYYSVAKDANWVRKQYAWGMGRLI